MSHLKILLVEDHAIVRQGLRLILEQEQDIKVVGEAQDSEEAYRMAKELHPDIVVMDIALPGASGVEATRRIKEELPQVHIVALTVHSEDEYILAMLRAGAEGYLVKDSIAAELVHAVRAVSQGQSILCPAAASKLIEEITHRYSPAVHANDALSKREEQILQLMATGATSKEIGERLHLSAKTVDNYRSSIMDKLHARNKTEAILYALKQGLISL